MLRDLKILIISIILALGAYSLVFSAGETTTPKPENKSTEKTIDYRTLNKEEQEKYLKCVGTPGNKREDCDNKVDAGKTKVNETQKRVVDLIIPIIEMLFYLNWLIISFLGVLMDNLLVYDPKITDFLHNMWLMFRNLSNSVLGIVLIIIAIKNALTGAGISGLGKAMQKFVIALVLINFSWFGVKIVVDVGTVVTNIVYRIPNEFGKGTFTGSYVKKIDFNYFPILGKKKDGDKEKKVEEFSHLICITEGDSNECKENMEFKGIKDDKTSTNNEKETSAQNSETQGNSPQATPENSMIVIRKESYDQRVEDSNSKVGANTIAGSIALNFLRLEETNKISAYTHNWSTLTFQVVFNILFSIMSAIVFVALGVALIERLMVLWIATMLSPLVVLSFGLESIGASIKELKFDAMFGKLVDYAVVIPAGVGLVFVITFIIMGQFLGLNIGESLKDDTNDPIQKIGGAWGLIIAIGTLGMLWKGSFKVLDKAAFSKTIIGGIQKTATRVAKGVGTQLSYMPLIPVGKGGGSEYKIGALPAGRQILDRMEKGGYVEEHNNIIEAQRKEDKLGIDVSRKDEISAKISNNLDEFLPNDKIKDIKNVHGITPQLIEEIIPNIKDQAKKSYLNLKSNELDYAVKEALAQKLKDKIKSQDVANKVYDIKVTGSFISEFKQMILEGKENKRWDKDKYGELKEDNVIFKAIQDKGITDKEKLEKVMEELYIIEKTPGESDEAYRQKLVDVVKKS